MKSTVFINDYVLANAGQQALESFRKLSPETVRRGLSRGLPTAKQKPFGLELAEDLLWRLPGAFDGRVPGPVWPAEDSHSSWTLFRGPRHSDLETCLQVFRLQSLKLVHQLGIRLLPELAQRIEIITRQLLRQGQESISVGLQ